MTEIPEVVSFIGTSLVYSENNIAEYCVNPLSPAIAKILAQDLQRYNSPADWARKLFKPSTDSASLLVEIEKKSFRFGFVVLWGRTSQVGLSFSFYWPSLRGPGRQSNEPIASLKFFFRN